MLGLAQSLAEPRETTTLLPQRRERSLRGPSRGSPVSHPAACSCTRSCQLQCSVKRPVTGSSHQSSPRPLLQHRERRASGGGGTPGRSQHTPRGFMKPRQGQRHYKAPCTSGLSGTEHSTHALTYFSNPGEGLQDPKRLSGQSPNPAQLPGGPWEGSRSAASSLWTKPLACGTPLTGAHPALGATRSLPAGCTTREPGEVNPSNWER